MITVHGRTRNQFYKGRADWRLVRNVRQAISIPLVVNGDIGSEDDAREALAQSGADAVMVGRAAVGRPWLPGLIARQLRGAPAAPPTPAARAADLIEHIEALCLQLGGAHGLRHSRKHIAAALDGAACAKKLRNLILTTNNPQQAIAMIEAAFSDCSILAAA